MPRELPPPCWQRDEWTREPNKQGTPTANVPRKTDEQMRSDLQATLRAQLICMTECSRRIECLTEATDRGPDNDHWVCGGYKGPERARVRAGVMRVPKYQKLRLNWDRLFAFTDGASFEDLAGEGSVRSVESCLNTYLWMLREQAGDTDVFDSFRSPAETVGAA